MQQDILDIESFALHASQVDRVKLNKSSAVAEIGDRGHIKRGPKEGGAVVPLSWTAGTPSNAMWPAPRSTSVPSGVFVHLAVSPQ